ncbi:unnamed protein product [Coregonus sp. 'balchen']|nr:unnamed protein product [Coregonus sp. 'balchen']
MVKKRMEELLRQSFFPDWEQIQDLAIRCIQKNIKKNKGVKGWPWWKVFTTVRPLIEEEIQQLKGRLEKVEKERNELRLNSDRLESRITELSSELADERNTGESASQLLESETSERLRLEKDMKDLQWRLKYERAIREIEFTKKRLQQEFDDKLEVEQQNKRQLERRLSDLQADSEEVQRTAQQLKKKCQRLTAELQDTKLHLEGQQSRNHDLEKKQRKFDSDQNLSQEEVQRERNLREKLSREKDMLTGEVFSLRQQLEDKDLEMCAQNVKLEQLEVELLDLSSQETKDEASLSKIEVQLEEEYDDKQKVLRERRDLETKLLSAQDQVKPRDVETEKRLRKDLKRTKALLADAQIMLDHMKNNAPSKREIAQLKNQSTQNLAQISDLQAQLEEALKEKQDVQEKLSALQSQLEFQETSMVEKSLVSRQEAKIREMETKMEFEKTQVKRLESLVARLKENLEKLTEERDHRSTSETREKEQNKRLQRQIRDIKEEMGELAKKEGEASRKKHELEMDIESLEAANQSLQADLKLAFKRIGDLQAAIEDEMESDDNEDLINSLQDMVTKYQKRRNKTEGDSSDSEVEDRVEGVKSWLSKNKGSTKNLSDDGSLKSSRSGGAVVVAGEQAVSREGVAFVTDVLDGGAYSETRAGHHPATVLHTANHKPNPGPSRKRVSVVVWIEQEYCVEEL